MKWGEGCPQEVMHSFSMNSKSSKCNLNSWPLVNHLMWTFRKQKPNNYDVLVTKRKEMFEKCIFYI